MNTLVSFLFLHLRFICCHVSLSYPKARKYDLDFLDNIHTPGDCGMYPGSDRTILEAGSLVNITWSEGYPHSGGYQLSLINHGNTTLLVGGEGWQNTTQHHLVTLPDTPCNICYIQIQIQGVGYVFRSCADVSIVPRGQYQETCSHHGVQSSSGHHDQLSSGGSHGILSSSGHHDQLSSGGSHGILSSGGHHGILSPGVSGCMCERLYHGTKCEYKAGCNTEEDCNGPKGQGECRELDNTLYPDR